MNELVRSMLEFWSLSEPNVVWVLSGSLLLGGTAGLVGCFSFLRRQSLMGDAMAHAALPGVTTAFMLTQSRNPLIILLGAALSCWFGMFSSEYLTTRTKIKRDSALALILSVFFALGVFQLTLIQKSPTASQAGLDKLLFGQAASLVGNDVRLLSALAIMVILVVFFCFSRFAAVIFDRNFAKAIGIHVRVYEMLLALTIVTAVVIGLQLVGVVLIAALILTPAAAARYWTNDLRTMVILAAIFGALSGAFGANVSYLAPRMPTGPWMVIAISVIFGISLLFAPRRGVVALALQQKNFRHRITDENILRSLFKLREAGDALTSAQDPSTVLVHRRLNPRELESSIQRLVKTGNLVRLDGKVQLTEAGLHRAEQLTRSHRLWERYLTDVAEIAPDHVHGDAEEIEHILTSDLEERLMTEISEAATDPHGRSIPSPERKEEK